MKEVEGFHDNKPSSKQIKLVVEEAVNDDELVKDDNCISLKERLVEDVKGIPTSNFSSKEEFLLAQDESLIEPQQDGQRKRLQR